MRSYWIGLALLAAAIAGCAPDAAVEEGATAARPPNIVVILADDLGYGDVHAYNPESRIPTPHLDRLAEQGMRFTDAHSASAVCSPSRYALLTGRYSWRTWLENGVLWPPDDTPLVEPERLTIAAMLREKGYRTAVIGKWHLGLEWSLDADGEADFNAPLHYGPNHVGFDESLIIAGSLDMIPYVYYRNHQPTAAVTERQEALGFPRFIREGPRADDFDPRDTLDLFTREAVSFIERSAADEAPFFLYLPLTAPHKPVWPAERFVGATDLGPYGDFIHQTDWTVGEVLNALDSTGAADQTLVVFSSDNGSFMYRLPEREPDHLDDATVQGYHPANHTANHIWRGTKADIWEAGHRVPFIVRWPGTTAPGSVNEQAIGLTDLMATFADITEYSLPEDAAEDSFSLLPLLTGNGWTTPRPPVVHHSSNGIFALRDGNWKMVFGNGSGGREQPVGEPFQEPYFLFDLVADPREGANQIEQNPDVAARLADELATIRASGRPNILFVVADDLNTRIGPYVDASLELHTPALDRLAAEGVTFTRAYSQYPVCGPSRASFMSGLYPETNGVRTNNFATANHRIATPALADHPTLARLLLDGGYYSARVSKIFHVGVPGGIERGEVGSDDPDSWDFAVDIMAPETLTPGVLEKLSRGDHYGSNFSRMILPDGEELTQADVLAADQAIAILENRAGAKPPGATNRTKFKEGAPFFLAVGFVRPHVPLIAAERHFDHYPDGEAFLPDVPPGDLDDVPDPAKRNGNDIAARYGMSLEEQRKAVAAYHASITFMDEQLGRLLDTLDRLGLRDDTIVVFTSDHGYNLGEHTMWQKSSLWEESVRVPLIISIPGMPNAGATNNAIVELIDLYPTFAEMGSMGSEVPAIVQGASLVPLLESPGAIDPEATAYTITGSNGASLRTDRWRYNRWGEEVDGDNEELYDHANDPGEFDNLARDPAYANILEEIRARFEDVRRIAGGPASEARR